MRHGNTGKKLGRDHAHRKALYSNLAGALIEHGRIKTTITKAKAVKPIAEQMITLGRRGDLHARRQAVAFLRSKDVVHKLFAEIGPRFADRPGGYSRIIKLGPRAGDAAEMVYLELLDEPVVLEGARGCAEPEADRGARLQSQRLPMRLLRTRLLTSPRLRSKQSPKPRRKSPLKPSPKSKLSPKPSSMTWLRKSRRLPARRLPTTTKPSPSPPRRSSR